MTQRAKTPPMPLDGVRVLELGSTAAGPACARHLADFGAEVVKIEPKEGDPIRRMGGSYKGKSLYGTSILRNKSIISADLRLAKGQDLVRRLLPAFDIVVENFRAGGLEKWGLGYEDLKKVKPDIIMVRITGFGQTGPYKDRAGYGIIGESMSGLRHLTGDPDRPPSRVAVPVTDYITAIYAAFGAMLALRAREQTGQGQYVDAALYECAFSLMEAHVPNYEKHGKVPKRVGSRLPDSTPNNLYESRDGEFIHITAMGDRVWQRLAAAMGKPELGTDPRYADQVSRSKREDELDGIIGGWTRKHDLADLERKLEDGGVPATRIFTMKDIFENAHYKAREMLVAAPDDDLGSVTLAGVAPKLSATPGKVRWAGRRVGQDTRAVLKRLGKLSDEEIDALAAEGVVYCDPKSDT